MQKIQGKLQKGFKKLEGMKRAAGKPGEGAWVRIVKGDFTITKPTLRLIIKVPKHFSKLKGAFL